MVERLHNAVCSYKSHIAQIHDLRSETAERFDEIQRVIKLDDQKELSELKSLQLPESELTTRPSVLFIGSQNCGKSSLINVFLKNPILPTDETPCTSRLVKIVYSPTNQTKIQDPSTKREEIKPFVKDKVPKNLVALEGERRSDCNDLKIIVEVGLDHPLLECGIELIDSPGRNENEALDSVVLEFVDKGIVPLIVYVVDGNNHLRESDRKTIRDLLDKFPGVSFMFVCSKADIDKKARKFDTQGEHGDSQESLAEIIRKKKSAVFKQLKKYGFLPKDDEMDSSKLFHGLSSTCVLKDRRKKRKTEEIFNFERFEKCLLVKLESSLREISQNELSALLLAQEMLLNSVVCKQQILSRVAINAGKEHRAAKGTEEAMFGFLSKSVKNRNTIINTIQEDMRSLSADLFQEAKNYKCASKISNKADLTKAFSTFIKNEFLDRSFNVLRNSFKTALKSILFETAISQTLVKAIIPIVNYLVLNTIFTGQTIQSGDNSQSVKMYQHLKEIMNSVEVDMATMLRTEIKGIVASPDINMISMISKPESEQWRLNVVINLISKVNIKALTNEVIIIFQMAVFKQCEQIRVKIDSLSFLNNILSHSNLDFVRKEHIPKVACLAARAYSMQYLLERQDPPKLGGLIKDTQHCQLYSCKCIPWVGQEEGLVKVVKKKEIEQNIWDETMRGCVSLLSLNKMLEQHPNILPLKGWYFPEPDQLYIIIEKAECDLLTALQGGLSWKRRKEIAIDVANGIQAIHGVGHVYDDLRAENIMLSVCGTAKINLAEPTNSYQATSLGQPFHISPRMFKEHLNDLYSKSYDIYAYGSLLWVLCEGSGTNSPKAYCDCQDIDSVKVAVCDRGITPERPAGTPDAWWELMSACWDDGRMNIKDVLDKALKLEIPD